MINNKDKRIKEILKYETKTMMGNSWLYKSQSRDMTDFFMVKRDTCSKIYKKLKYHGGYSPRGFQQ